MVDKKEPHTDLQVVQDMVREGKRRMTISAYNGGAALGFSTRVEMYEAVLALTPADFHKSMEAIQDPGYWQEVYRPTYNGQQIYLKLIVKDDVVIVSFKEK